MVDIKSVLRILEDQEVPDIDLHPYRCGTNMLYATAAAYALATVPRETWDEEEIVVQAHILSRRFRHWYESGPHDTHHNRIALPNGMTLTETVYDGRGLHVMNAGGRVIHHIRLSTVHDGLKKARSITTSPEDAETAARALHPIAWAEIRRLASEGIDDLQPMTLTRTNHDTWRFGIPLQGGMDAVVEFQDEQLVHDSDERNLQAFRNEAADIVEAVANWDWMTGRHGRRMGEIIQDLQSRTDLPIVYRFVMPSVSRGRHDPGKSIRLVADGYGMTGALSTESVAHIDESEIANLPDVHYFLERQTKRHARYGPCPGSVSKGDWTIDIVTARRVASDSHARCKLDAFIEGRDDGRTNRGLSLRAVGRTIHGTFDLGPRCTWKGDRLDLSKMQLPETLLSAIKGQSMETFVAHDFLKGVTVGRNSRRVGRNTDVLTIHAKVPKIDYPSLKTLAGAY